MSKVWCLLAVAAIGLLATKVNGQARIIGGQNAKNGQFSHHVQLRNIIYSGPRKDPGYNVPYCSGSIIAERFVLTTAYCLDRLDTTEENILVYAGAVNVSEYETIHEVDKLIRHPEYKHYRFGYDIALVRVAQSFVFTPNVAPIDLPTEDISIDTDGTAVPVWFSGWGRERFTIDGAFQGILQWLNTTAISRPECLRLMGSNYVGGEVTVNDVCIRNMEGGGACNMDHGGAIITHNSTRTIIGVFSFLANYCWTSTPYVFARVFPHLTFIHSAMEQ